MVNFLLLFEKIIKYTKKQINKGLTPQKIYELCSCIRETFCLSYSIRKNNNLYVYFQEENLLLSFIGKKLRYLGPDERSQALLLLKALTKLQESNSIKADITKSTPGIYVKKFQNESSFLHYFNSLINGNVYFIIDYIKSIYKDLIVQTFNNKLDKIEESDFYLIPTYIATTENVDLIKRFIQMKSINFLSLSKIKPIENKILYINFQKDRQEIL
ncbi:MAG: hypothetical protein ACFFFT_07460 [Candidatus Thorarchaeota archaeon]